MLFRSGESAAAWARGAADPPKNGDRLEAACRKILAPLRQDRGVAPGPVLDEVEAIADDALGVRRCAEKLQSGLARTVALRREVLPRLSVQSPSRRYNLEWIQALQLENQLFCLEAALRAALERSESRGQHWRSDFEGLDNRRWLCRLHFENRGQELTIRHRMPCCDGLEPPVQNYPGVLDYAVDCRRQERKDPQ